MGAVCKTTHLAIVPRPEFEDPWETVYDDKTREGKEKMSSTKISMLAGTKLLEWNLEPIGSINDIDLDNTLGVSIIAEELLQNHLFDFFVKFGSKQNFEKYIDRRKHAVYLEQKMVERTFGSKITGMVHIEYPNGSEYIGMLKEGIKEGKGELYNTKTGRAYKGNFKSGFMHGYGTFCHKSGVLYRGQFSYDFRHGAGELTDPSKKIFYKGEFRVGEIHGKGTITYDGNYYEGEFKNGRKNGIGKHSSVGGAIKYDGAFKEDQFCGIGILTTDNYVHKGEFKKNRKNGQGIQKMASGMIIRGTWKDDELEGFIEFETKDIMSSGHYSRGKLISEAVTKFKNGDKFVGKPQFGFKDGIGTYKYYLHSEFLEYRGSFSSSLFHGPGELISSKKVVTTGNFWRGKPVAPYLVTLPPPISCTISYTEADKFPLLTYPSSSTYRGELSSTFDPHGTGTLTTWDGWVYEGQWIGGKLGLEGKITRVGSSTSSTKYTSRTWNEGEEIEKPLTSREDAWQC